MQPPQVSLLTWPRLRRTRGEPSAQTWGICPDHRNLRIFFVFTFSTIFYKKKQNKTCSNMSQKLRVKPLSLSDNLQERLDTWLGRIRRVKRSKMATRKFCSTFFTIFEVFLLCFTHLSAREVKKCLSWLYLMLS